MRNRCVEVQHCRVPKVAHYRTSVLLYAGDFPSVFLDFLFSDFQPSLKFRLKHTIRLRKKGLLPNPYVFASFEHISFFSFLLCYTMITRFCHLVYTYLAHCNILPVCLEERPTKFCTVALRVPFSDFILFVPFLLNTEILLNVTIHNCEQMSLKHCQAIIHVYCIIQPLHFQLHHRKFYYIPIM